MSVGLNPIFNYIVDRFENKKIFDASPFEDYFNLYPDTTQFGYKQIVGLKSSSTCRSTLCFLLILAQELNFLKIPYNRTQQLQQHICSYLNLDLSKAYDKKYLLEKHLDIQDQEKKIQKGQLFTNQQSINFKKNMENTQSQRSQNPFGNLNSFMKNTTKEPSQKIQPLIFDQEIQTKKIIEWGKSTLFSNEKPLLQTKKEREEINQALIKIKNPLFDQKLLNNNQQEKTNNQKNFPLEDNQIFTVKLSKRNEFDFDMSELSKKQRTIVHQYQLLKRNEEIYKNQNQIEKKITETNVNTKEIEVFQLKEIEEKVTVETQETSFQLPQFDQISIEQTNINTKEIGVFQLNTIEEKITVETQETSFQLPQFDQISIEQTNQSSNQYPQSENESIKKNDDNQIITNDDTSINETLINENQNSQTKNQLLIEMQQGEDILQQTINFDQLCNHTKQQEKSDQFLIKKQSKLELTKELLSHQVMTQNNQPPKIKLNQNECTIQVDYILNSDSLIKEKLQQLQPSILVQAKSFQEKKKKFQLVSPKYFLLPQQNSFTSKEQSSK